MAKNRHTLLLLCLFMLSGALHAQIKATENSNSEKRTIEIVVHRGANHLAPENTVAAAILALKHGATWIELDVRSSKDGILYNLHDETLDRTTNGKGLIRETTSQDIDGLDAGSWFNSTYAGVKVPRIAEMLDSLKGRANIFFDVKRGIDVVKLIALVKEKGYEESSFFWFADPDMLTNLIQLAPNLRVKVNANNVEGLKKWMKVCKPSIVETEPQYITPAFHDFCQKQGIKIMAAIQNGTVENYHQAILTEPDMVNLDQPELFEQVLKSFQP